MSFSFSTFFAASIAIALMTLFLKLLVSKTTLLTRFGIYSAYFFAIAILIRSLIPVEFNKVRFTQSLYSYRILPAVSTFLEKPLLSIDSFDLTLRKLAAFLWIFGTVILLTQKLTGYFRFKKSITALATLDDNPVIFSVFQRASMDYFPESKRHYRIVKADLFDTPALFGWKKPVILLPDISYTEEELYYVFAHELLHTRHRDFPVKVLCDIIVAVYWWNPIISLFLLPIIGQIQELAVDCQLTYKKPSDETLHYLDGLTKTLAHQVRKTPSSVHTLLTSASPKRIKQRFVIITERKSKKLSVPGTFLILLIFLFSYTFVFEPSFSPTHDENGNPVYEFEEGNSYYVRNGKGYDLFLNNEFITYTDTIYKEFSKLPIYNSLKEVPQK